MDDSLGLARLPKTPPETVRLIQSYAGMPAWAPWARVWTPHAINKADPFVLSVIESPPYEPTIMPLATTGTLVKWHGYSFDLFGMVTQQSPDEMRWPFLRLPVREGFTDFVVQLWVQWARFPGSPLVAEILWQPGDSVEGREATRGASRGGKQPTTRQKQAAQHGLRLLRQIPMIGRPWEDVGQARRRLLGAALELKQRNCIIDRETLSMWTPGVGTVNGVADLLDRAGWAMTPRTGRPVIRAIADEVHSFRRRRGLTISDAIDLAEQCAWDFDRLEHFANKAHIGLGKGP